MAKSWRVPVSEEHPPLQHYFTSGEAPLEYAACGKMVVPAYASSAKGKRCALCVRRVTLARIAKSLGTPKAA